VGKVNASQAEDTIGKAAAVPPLTELKSCYADNGIITLGMPSIA